MIRRNVLLKDYSNYKIGGPAAYFLEVISIEELINGLNEWKVLSKDFSKNKKEIFILGEGTNILINEQGFDGLIIHNSIRGIEKSKENITVGAGELISDVLNFCVINSLSGMEWAGGLPGTIGGSVRGNAGAFKGEIKDSISLVTSMDFFTFEIKKRNNRDCFFNYRESIFKNKDAENEIIVSSVFKLTNGNTEQIKKETQEKINYRYQKHPMEYPNIGSTFKNIPFKNIPNDLKKELSQYVKDDPFPVVPVAKLLYLSGVMGERRGDAQISEKHPNFIVNLGNAKSEDVKTLINFAKDKVKEKFGLKLQEEIMYL